MGFYCNMYGRSEETLLCTFRFLRADVLRNEKTDRRKVSERSSSLYCENAPDDSLD